MENITIGQISAAAAYLLTLAGSVAGLIVLFQKIIKKMLKTEFDGINISIRELKETVGNVDMAACKNFLVVRISELKRGEKFDESTRKRFIEQYDHYVKCGGNSYIKYEVEQLKKEGKI